MSRFSLDASTSVLLAVIYAIVVSCACTFADTEPSCGCVTCPATIIPCTNFATITTSEPFMNNIWADTSSSSNCCGNDYTVELSISSKTVTIGGWTAEAGIDFGMELPTGYELGANGSITKNGETTEEVEGGVKSTCVLGHCQGNSLEAGPEYIHKMRKVPTIKMCYSGVLVLQAWPAQPYWSCIQPTLCSAELYYKYSWCIYLHSSCAIRGDCGIPYSGCAACVVPSQPQCP